MHMPNAPASAATLEAPPHAFGCLPGDEDPLALGPRVLPGNFCQQLFGGQFPPSVALYFDSPDDVGGDDRGAASVVSESHPNAGYSIAYQLKQGFILRVGFERVNLTTLVACRHLRCTVGPFVEQDEPLGRAPDPQLLKR